MKLTVGGLEKERDFYFGKLRDIEVLCQEAEAEQDPVIKQIIQILYATEVRCFCCLMGFIYFFIVQTCALYYKNQNLQTFFTAFALVSGCSS